MVNNIGTKLIETQRLILRKIEITDAEDMFNNWANDDDVSRYLTWTSHKDISESKNIISMWVEELKSDSCYRWCIVLKETNHAIGCIDVVKLNENLECGVIGYCLSKQYWNKGIMTEALIAVENFLFSKVNLNRIEAYHYTGNPASGKVMIKSGMQFEGIKRQGAKNNIGEFCDLANYAILKSDWENAQIKI